MEHWMSGLPSIQLTITFLESLATQCPCSAVTIFCLLPTLNTPIGHSRNWGWNLGPHTG